MSLTKNLVFFLLNLLLFGFIHAPMHAQAKASVGDFIWEDINGDGLIQVTEPGIPDAQIILSGMNSAGISVNLTTISDAQGKYRFDSLLPGTYVPEFNPCCSFTPTIKADEFVPGNKINPNRKTDPFVLSAGQLNTALDAGFYRSASLEGYIWLDTVIRNGIQDVIEPPVPNIPITLEGETTTGLNLNYTAISDASGKFIFFNIPPGQYKLSCSNLSSHFAITLANQGNSDELDNDFLESTLATHFFVIQSGDIISNLDLGLIFKPTKIGDFIWGDLNKDGIQQIGEPGIPGIEVTTIGFELSGVPLIKTTISDLNGHYFFELPAGTYKLSFAKPNGFNFTKPLVGNVNTDSNVDTLTGSTPFFTISGNSTQLGFDAGYTEFFFADFTSTHLCEQQKGSITPNFVVGIPPLSYLWSDGSTSASRSELDAGNYSLTITDGQGKMHLFSFQLHPPVKIEFPTQIHLCGLTNINMGGTNYGGKSPYKYKWSNGPTDSIGIFTTSGTYNLTITDAKGCSASKTIAVTVIPPERCAFVSGKVISDHNQNCIDDAEPLIPDCLIQISGNNEIFYSNAASDGTFTIGLTPNVTYKFKAIPPTSNYTSCPELEVLSPIALDTLFGQDLLLNRKAQCPLAEVALSSLNLRSCFENNTYTSVIRNKSTTPLLNAYAILDLDPNIEQIITSNITFNELSPYKQRFELGDIGAFEEIQLWVKFKLKCGLPLGTAVCSKIEVFPHDNCIVVNPLWSGASIQLEAQCVQDSFLCTLRNTGSGNMTTPVNYTVRKNHQLYDTAPVQLDAAETFSFKLPVNGNRWHISIPQEAFHPGESLPQLSLLKCQDALSSINGQAFYYAPQDDQNPWSDISCNVTTGSFDPNDKQGFPVGYGSQHYIEPGTTLEYLIRFQNTGNDTAFNIRVIDTLSNLLDPTSIRLGASSHPYTFSLSGTGIATFQFDNVMLPDSNVNELASHGYIQFFIDHRDSAALESVIENTAAIYFDYNEPIFTNTTVHRLGRDFYPLGLFQPIPALAFLQIAPNPGNQQIQVALPPDTPQKDYTLNILDVYGRGVSTFPFEQTNLSIQVADWPNGTYFLELIDRGRLVAGGKLQVQH